jgi:DNA-binding MarR family transcriptional regulator
LRKSATAEGELEMRRRYQALAVIYRFIRTHGYCPSMREIAGRLGIRASSVALGYCRRLKDEGLVDYVPKVNRTVHLTPAGVSYLQTASPWPGNGPRIDETIKKVLEDDKEILDGLEALERKNMADLLFQGEPMLIDAKVPTSWEPIIEDMGHDDCTYCELAKNRTNPLVFPEHTP